MRGAIPGTIAALLALSGPALAGDDMFDIAFGTTVTSDYVSRGISQTNGDPALQGYAELDYGIAYAGIWASNVDFGTDDVEIDYTVGIRPELGDFAFDFGWAQYTYADDTSPAYGEAHAQVKYSGIENLTLGGDVYFAPDYSQDDGTATYVEGNVDYTLPNGFGLSAALGYQSFENSLGLPDYTTWNAGGYWTYKDTLTVDLRYYDTDLSSGQCGLLSSPSNCDARFVASLSVDSSLSALKGE